MPSTILPSCQSATLIQYIGKLWTKLVVPSIGSMIHIKLVFGSSLCFSSARTEDWGSNDCSADANLSSDPTSIDVTRLWSSLYEMPCESSFILAFLI